MKKIFMFFALMALVGTATVNAQTCTKSKEACTAAAMTAANTDVNIEKRICEQSGKVSFVRKDICAVSGKTSYTNVEYNADTKKFVNVSPTHTTKGATKASCCSSKAKATSTSASTPAKSSCCSKGSAASCTKKTTTTTAVKKTTTAQAVKVSND